MASKDIYTVKYTCKNYNAVGKVTISENDYPFMKKLDRNVVSYEGNIKSATVSEDKLIVICSECGLKMV